MYVLTFLPQSAGFTKLDLVTEQHLQRDIAGAATCTLVEALAKDSVTFPVKRWIRGLGTSGITLTDEINLAPRPADFHDPRRRI